MSLCFSYFDEDKIFVAADSRVSVSVNGVFYFVTDKYKKIRRIGDKVIFFSGDVDLAEWIFNSVNERSTLKSIEQSVQDNFHEFNMKCASDDSGFVMKILLMEQGKPAYFFMNSQDLKLRKQGSSKGQIYSMGANQGEALAHCLKIREQFEGIDEAIYRSFEYVADETVGGTLYCYIISNDGIVEGQGKIKDNKPLRTYKGRVFPYHCDLRGNLTASNVNLSGNINMTGGSISWANVGKPSYTATEVGARSANWLPTPAEIGAVYNNQTAVFNALTNNGTNQGLYMSGGNLYINASYIRSGLISASLIDTTNLSAQKIYQKDYPNNYAVIGGAYGDLQLFYQGNKYFSVYNGLDHVKLQHRNRDYLTFSSSTGKAHPVGGWDFSGATVTGLNTLAVFG
ncbi:hypothetical protein ACE41H_20325 [Paenibacillus enshidis]|uniref:Uncharacterized protein n=1 Tax=Paenibacillus enshidis TaxID=1458439 RepID=A0ABV5AY20_9BACL